MRRYLLRRSDVVRAAAAVSVAALLVGLLVATGFLAGAQEALVVMGFDPDRAQLITALLASSIASAGSVLLADRRRIATLAGFIALVALFANTFATETTAALASSGAQGQFDPAGWLETVVAIVFAGLAIAWASAVVAGEVRSGLLGSVGDLVATARSRSDARRNWWRPLVTAVLMIVAIVGVPVFGDMVNFSPDAHMRVGAPPAIGLTSGPGMAPSEGFAQVPAGAPQGRSYPVGPFSGQSAAPGLLPPQSSGAGTTSNARPWLAWRPTGPGRLLPKIQLPPPWTNGSDPFATLTVYLPPGYDSGSRRYPVVYEVPWTFDLWERSIQITGMLDTLIDGGQIPPVIVAFVAQNGAPIPDSECEDSSDGRQQIETYMSKTVVDYMDRSFRTIATPTARALFGFSEGGFCAAMLLLRHPDVFDAAISMSGYFDAALRSGPTVNAWRPFGNDPRLVAEHSPLVLAPTLQPEVRQKLFLVVSSDPSEVTYGPQYEAFASALESGGYRYLLLPTRLGHSWNATRTTLPIALQAVAGRWAATGVFSGAK